MDKTVQSFQMPGPVVTFNNLCYTVKENRGLCRRNGPEKEILKNVSGIMRPGINAIMGPTGSGKTSLLDVIAGRKDPAGLRSGQVLVDGKAVTSDLRLSSAYVVQDDILMGTLSVRESLTFSANLRLPHRLHSSLDKQQKVNNVIKELSLQDCADTKFLRGVSGGERKRCSVGMELITSPSLLFLDEPTTGLDANTANSIISLLHRLSRKGKTVIFSIHQPRYSIFRQFDHLTLMNKGEVIYAGAASQAMDYFEHLGYQREEFNNPADFFLDIINGDIVPNSNSSNAGYVNGNIEESDRSLLAHQYRQSEYCDQVTEQLKHLSEAMDPSVSASQTKASYATSFHYQTMFFPGGTMAIGLGVRILIGTSLHMAASYFIACLKSKFLVLAGRTMKNILRNPQTSYAQMALNIFFAILVGLIYYQIPDTLPEGVQNRIGAFFFLVINMVFGNLSAVELFINERALFIHENSSGYYRTSVYFLSKVFADLLPNRILPIFIFSSISYYMMGLKPDAEAFFLFALTMCMASLAAVSLAFLVSASVASFAMANILIALPYVFMMVFGGFLVNLNSMLSWLSWLKWASIFRYGLEAVTINEMKGQVFRLGNLTVTGEMYMKAQEIDYSLWGFWQNQVALLGIMLVCMSLAYIQLLRINRWK